MPKRIATWSTTRDVWETEQGDLLSGRSDVFSETWPTSGMTRNGVAYERPTWAPATSATGSFSSPDDKTLPTPTTRDWKDGARCENVPVNSLLGQAVWDLA